MEATEGVIDRRTSSESHSETSQFRARDWRDHSIQEQIDGNDQYEIYIIFIGRL